MLNEIRRLPIGIQSFESIRREGYIYVDKTEYIYKLLYAGKPFFLSRPRRFGKSLLLSTMKAFWEGKKELFHGLAIERLMENEPDAFAPYPVFYFDFNRDDFTRASAIEDILNAHLVLWEKTYGINESSPSLAIRFQNLIVSAYEQTGRPAVVLVDEYDKPLLEVMNTELEEHNKAVFKGFFSTLKSYDQYLQFVFLTGVTKFSKISIFSDLNQLQDISMSKDYADICGITEEEMTAAFAPEIERMAAEQDISPQECLEMLREMYDGYHFYPGSAGVYNPFSLISALQSREFGTYWFSTGTPTFLINKLEAVNFNARSFTDNTLYADGNMLSDYRADNPNPVPLFYQTGYLTIVDYDSRKRRYTLGYPNNEVKYGFLESLAPSYLHDSAGTTGTDIYTLDDYIEVGNLDGVRDIFTALFARLPYSNDDRPLEQNFQNVIYIVFELLGKFIRSEIHSSLGRADAIVETDRYVYIFEFKRDGSADDALAQIDEKGYALPYAADSRTLYKIGVNFNSETRNIDEWKVMP